MVKTECEVVVVGAGPVGLFAALRLSEFGISTIVIEAEKNLVEDLRASTFHPPTLDILDEFGITDQLIAQGRICPTWQVRMHPSNDKAEFHLDILKDDTRHPYRLQCEQFHLCRFLLTELKKRNNVDVRFGNKLTGLTQSSEQVTLDIETDKGEETLSAAYIIGADGARSTVRGCLDFKFEGQTYPENTILATTTFPFEEHLPGLSGINYVWKPSGTFSLLHLPQLWRCSLYPDAGETTEEAMRPESIERKLQEIVPSNTPYPVHEIRSYRLHMRIVDDYRKGRVVLAGDSAHVNSPSGGMGMNGGLHDAYFLTDYLSKILSGESEQLLDLYTRQRRPVAHEQILSQADANRKRMQERDPAKRKELFDGLCRTANDSKLSYEYLLKSSMIVGWRNSMLTV